MQQKQYKAGNGKSRMGGFLVAVCAVVAIGFGALMMMDVPAPKQPIEKKLDPAPFLEQHEQKQP